MLHLGHYLGVSLVFVGAIGAILYLLYLHESTRAGIRSGDIESILWRVFLVFSVIAGVAAWLLVLAQATRKVAQEESLRQTQLLMQEIEAHKRTDAQLQKAKEAAESANLAKSRYVTSISHELRTPLNSVLGYAQLLRDDAATDRQRDAIEVIRRSTEHLAGLIDGLLDIAKIEAGKLHLHRGEVFFRDLLEQMVKMFRLQAEAKGLAFRFEADGDLPELVYADEWRLRQVLINLLSNAIKFTERGHVTLRVRYARQLARIEIEDSGIGIAPEDLERVFLPFERGRLGAGSEAGGTRLGLTISKLLVEIMGGRLRARSQPGVGSSFDCTLMLSEVSTPTLARPGPRRVRGYAAVRRTIAVTDDDPGHLGLLSNLLDPLGFHVVCASSARQCLDIAAAMHVDLFLLDVNMPERNGWELARAACRGAGGLADRDGLGQRLREPARPGRPGLPRRFPGQAGRLPPAAGEDPPAPAARMALRRRYVGTALAGAASGRRGRARRPAGCALVPGAHGTRARHPPRPGRDGPRGCPGTRTGHPPAPAGQGVPAQPLHEDIGGTACRKPLTRLRAIGSWWWTTHPRPWPCSPMPWRTPA